MKELFDGVILLVGGFIISMLALGLGVALWMKLREWRRMRDD